MSESLLLEKVSFSNRPAQDALSNSYALTGSKGENLGWLVWKSVPRSWLIQAKVVQLFASFLLCFLALLLGGTAIIRTLLRTTPRIEGERGAGPPQRLHDAMTGLPNRADFFQKLRARLQQRDGLDSDDPPVIVAYSTSTTSRSSTTRWGIMSATS